MTNELYTTAVKNVIKRKPSRFAEITKNLGINDKAESLNSEISFTNTQKKRWEKYQLYLLY